MLVCTLYVYMTKARIRWCTCRVKNVLTLGKLLSLWFCFLLHSILFFISQTSYRTYKIISSNELARPVMGTIFLVVEMSQLSGASTTPCGWMGPVVGAKDLTGISRTLSAVDLAKT